MLEGDDVDGNLGEDAGENAVVGECSVWRCLDDVVRDDIDCVVQVSEAVSGAEDDTRSANARENDSIDVLGIENLLELVSSASIVPRLSDDEVILRDVESRVDLRAGRALHSDWAVGVCSQCTRRAGFQLWRLWGRVVDARPDRQRRDAAVERAQVALSRREGMDSIDPAHAVVDELLAFSSLVDAADDAVDVVEVQSSPVVSEVDAGAVSRAVTGRETRCGGVARGTGDGTAN